MIGNILELLKVAKSEKEIGELTYIALGGNKLPENFREGLKLIKLERWRKK